LRECRKRRRVGCAARDTAAERRTVANDDATARAQCDDHTAAAAIRFTDRVTNRVADRFNVCATFRVTVCFGFGGGSGPNCIADTIRVPDAGP
jgi:hypothetical protein